ncbi:GntR family transcriptional regulator [Streptomyces sp. NPDC001407]|uniref:GntR family transcriptional regulator n=1 Tax=Streptomyces sp. NPDC001407 TaxID=3364573 RepID=UPI003688A8FF
MTSQNPYESAAAALRADILRGTFTSGESLPGQRVLAGRYGVAPNTMGDALRLLAKEGLVEMAPRRRTRVLQPAAPMEARLSPDGLISPVDAGGASYDELRPDGRGAGAIAAEIPFATEALGLAPNVRLFVRQVTLLHTGVPWALQTLFTTEAPGAAPGAHAGAVAPFLAGTARSETRHTSRWSARPATPDERELLRAGPQAVVTEMRRVGFVEDRPHSYLLTVVRADRATILTESGN